ncbi:hypothetical protein LSPCS325_27620 [Lysinibacillus sp. CTST325]
MDSLNTYRTILQMDHKGISHTTINFLVENSELKNGHWYDTASTAGLFGMEIQGATTIFTVNLKRILKY